MTFFIRTFGCQMNQADSAGLAAVLAAAGHRPVSEPESAELIIFNTCAVRDHAEERLFQNLAALRPRPGRPGPRVIGLVGCIPSLRGESLFNRFPHLSFLAGPEQLDQVADLAARSAPGLRLAALGPGPAALPAVRGGGSVSAFLPVIRGCDNFCSYCVVPYTRGREASRSASELLEAAAGLAAGGVRELILLGQNVNSYRDPAAGSGFPELLAAMAGLDGLLRIGFLTSHPKDASEDLFRTMAEESRVYRHLHLPLQSGSDRILAAMNRRYTAAVFSEKVVAARLRVADLSVTSDLIVGFPGETESDFQATLELLSAVRFDDLYAFKYSDRPGTRAQELGEKVAETVKAERLARVWALQDAISRAANRERLGSEAEVLFLRRSGRKNGWLVGKTGREQTVLVEGGPELIGRLGRVRIVSADRQLLYGRIA
ncbi:MAG TPA: tRNA (N6-isopentenyl adenosine(37)-C2)-methylthiotransferase MiaB [bacterium]|nr:tRNA (N6-isopentenyl adenosine(37)-C2)-methylthiotransferase MiaB [bacterium]HNS49397.1 tRNA (N6-isopentenyl adenosine(37)-C2)-methylthiotransferase MiaB [bacterium]